MDGQVRRGKITAGLHRKVNTRYCLFRAATHKML